MAKKPTTGESETPPRTGASPYLVLARKYRPDNFDGLVGQDAMVRTLTNAFKQNRIAHAFMLTGVRGVGKTTTARILARALNFEDDSGAHPDIELKSEGKHCRAIIESRHVDVVEMDAASHTGIDDIREINESTRYGPVSAPYKVFIIDEVHMLSKNAFNGLLKTLEEPPPYVKFIFATTEIRKVPVTILSRCQRFDLRRIPAPVLTDYLNGILATEKVEIDADALSLLVRAGEGSARDTLSLLDQAIAHGDGRIAADPVREMLGLADRSQTIALFEHLMAGRIAEALDLLNAQYVAGADPAVMLGDLAGFTHVVTRLKVVPGAADDPTLTPEERERGAGFAALLSIRHLARTWQMLQAGLGEVQNAGDAMQAAEMVLIRLAHSADLPTPDELISKLQTTPPSQGSAPRAGTPSRTPAQPVSGPAMATAAPAHVPSAEAGQMPELRDYAGLVALAGEKRDLLLKHALEAQVVPVTFQPGRIEIALSEGANSAVVQTLSARLREWTGKPWMVSVAGKSDAPTLRQQQEAARQSELDAALEDPLVREVLDTFPGARVINVRIREDVEDALDNPEPDEDE